MIILTTSNNNIRRISFSSAKRGLWFELSGYTFAKISKKFNLHKYNFYKNQGSNTTDPVISHFHRLLISTYTFFGI